jgi:hypothetical protein
VARVCLATFLLGTSALALLSYHLCASAPSASLPDMGIDIPRGGCLGVAERALKFLNQCATYVFLPVRNAARHRCLLFSPPWKLGLMVAFVARFPDKVWLPHQMTALVFNDHFPLSMPFNFDIVLTTINSEFHRRGRCISLIFQQVPISHPQFRPGFLECLRNLVKTQFVHVPHTVPKGLYMCESLQKLLGAFTPKSS